jgi:hypothetical protein
LKRTLLSFALLAASCKSAPPPAVPPPWTELPPVISEAVCMRARSEAVGTEAPIAIVKTTQRIVNGQSIDALAHAYGVSFGGPAQAADLIARRLTELPVLLPMSGGGSCAFRPIDAHDQGRVTDVMLLQLSSPFVNPFTKRESGLFARLSVGGHDATWYWIPIAERKGLWLVGTVLPLDLHEN